MSNQQNSADAVAAGRTLNITRKFNAPREVVWDVWTKPEHVKEWWGPEGFTAPVVKIDFRVGGMFLGCMRGPDGKDYWSAGIYQEIERPEKIVVTDYFSDEEGNRIDPSIYGMEGDWSRDMMLTVLFEEEDGATTVHLKHSGFPTEGNMSEMAEAGWGQSLDKFEAQVEKAANQG